MLKAFNYAGYVVGAVAVVAVVLVFWHRLRAYRDQQHAGGAESEV